MAVTNVAELNALVERVKKAQREYASFTQEQVDKIFRAAALAAADARIPLAKMAVAESGMGIVEDKVIKNHFASEYIYNAYKDEKTCGVLSEDDTLVPSLSLNQSVLFAVSFRPLTRLQLLSSNR
ncbi:alcohol dehydrogenase [Escherichia coli]|nr:alcohol dehydrogenase [Escherichia coli]